MTFSTAPYVKRLAHELLDRFSRPSPAYDGESLSLIERVLDFAAHAEQQLSEQRQRIAYLESLARTDELTGLHNRRGLEDALTALLASAARHKENGVVCYVDLDRFKQVNDRHGHQAGDEVLMRVADTLSDNVRASDVVARVGGDEFVIVLTHITLRDGLKKAKSLRARLNALTVELEGVEIPVRASIGIHAYGPETTLEQLLADADHAMYADKRDRSGVGDLVRIGTVGAAR